MEEDDKKKEAWVHDKEISFKNVTGHLETLKEAVQKTIDEERRRLTKMKDLRSSFKK